MAALGDTLARLLAQAQAAALHEPSEGSLSLVQNFGANPGALQMWLHLPQELPPRSPLVVVLHGCGQTAAGYAAGAGWIDLAERYGFALLCPAQVRANNANLCFNWFEPGDTSRDAGEAASIAQMVEWAVSTHDLDARRVFVTGLSAGGAMAAVSLATYPEVFSAGAVIAGLPYGAASGMQQALAAMRHVPDLPARSWGDKVRAAAPAPIRWPRISVWHGDADGTVNPSAGEASVRQWCDVHGVDRFTQEQTARDGHRHQVWRGCDGEVAVELHRIAGLGHGTPIEVAGADGCGSPAPWILQAGVSSSLEIARSWGIAGTRRSTPPRTAQTAPDPTLKSWRKPQDAVDVGETIAKALRGAGLIR